MREWLSHKLRIGRTHTNLSLTWAKRYLIPYFQGKTIGKIQREDLQGFSNWLLAENPNAPGWTGSNAPKPTKSGPSRTSWKSEMLFDTWDGRIPMTTASSSSVGSSPAQGPGSAALSLKKMLIKMRVGTGPS
jgi:hypothetical protein